MTAYKLFKKCQGILGRKYRGSIDDFKSLNQANYYYGLKEYLNEKIGKNINLQFSFIDVCGSYYGSRFNPFELLTEEYMKIFKEWDRVHSSRDSYKKHILNSIQNIYEFCQNKKIGNLKDYVFRWSVSNIISGLLDENVAFILEVHKIPLTKPEKKLIKKQYLDKVDIIRNRLDVDGELKKMIVDNLEKVQKNIN